MLEFKPYASGSSGNMYVVTDGETKVMLDAGLPYKDIQRLLDFKTHEIDAVCISHSHKDHCEGVEKLLKAGLDVYMLEATKEEIGLSHRRIRTFEYKKPFQINTLQIMPFDVEHDVENAGFLIQDDSHYKLLYATDTYYVKYRFKNINILAVECNYDDEILEQNILDGRVHVGMRPRLSQSHFSLGNFKNFVTANKSESLQEVWLLHISNRNGNEERFKKEIQKISGTPVYVA